MNVYEPDGLRGQTLPAFRLSWPSFPARSEKGVVCDGLRGRNMNSTQEALRSVCRSTAYIAGMNGNSCLHYASCLAEDGKYLESVEALCYAVKTYSLDVSKEKLVVIVRKVVNTLRARVTQVSSKSSRNLYSCPTCYGVLYEPVTLPCGHTYCNSCLTKESITECAVCFFDLGNVDLSRFQMNFLISSLVSQFWSHEVKSVTLRNLGNKHFREGDLLESLQAYNEAVKYAPHDHLVLSNRSHILLTLGRKEEALEDAIAGVVMQPRWAKGYFRVASALLSLGREKETMAMFLFSALGNTNLSIVAEEIAEILLKTTCDDAVDTPTGECSSLDRMISTFILGLENLNSGRVAYQRVVNPEKLNKSDFECTICYLYFWKPVTTRCGHTFCRSCLDRSLDHSAFCPLCKSSLKDFLADRRSSTTEVIEEMMKSHMPEEVMERSSQYEDELSEFCEVGLDCKAIPIFVATLAIPSVACPLHVFEPPYRLMIRRCMETGTRQFGMCMPREPEENGYAKYGTTLEIRDIKYIADGRSIINAVGCRRFRCLSKGTKDGYNIASVQLLQDDCIPFDSLSELQLLHDSVHLIASKWYSSIPVSTQMRILCHYGEIPSTEPEYWKLLDGPTWLWWIIAILPLEPSVQIRIVRETSLRKRLKFVYHILRCLLIYQNGVALGTVLAPSK